MKALRVGNRSMPWRAIEVRRESDGAPILVLSGAASALADEAGLSDFAVSLTHEPDYAVRCGGGDRMNERIRRVLASARPSAGRRRRRSPTTPTSTRPGMTSHASVNVMLALEDEFDVEFPDEMLKRSVFESIAAIAAALARARTESSRMSVAVDAATQTFLDGVGRIADEVAAPHADDVDREARFPTRRRRAARGAARSRRSCPTSSAAAASRSRTSPRRASSSGGAAARAAMVFAMHQIQVACLVRHLDGAPWFEDVPARRSCAEQRLIASVTSEVGTGGDMGRSIAAVDAGRRRRLPFEKQAPTVSYGAHADDLLTTLRRAPDADGRRPGASCSTRKDAGRRSSRRARGTRSACAARARPGSSSAPSFAAEQVLPPPFADDRARRRWCRSRTSSGRTSGSASRPTPSTAPAPSCARRRKRQPGRAARRRRRASRTLMTRAVAAPRRGRLGARASSSTPTRRRGRERPRDDGVGAALQQPQDRGLRAGAARLPGRARASAASSGFKNDTPFSVGRHLRDAMSAALMIAQRAHPPDQRGPAARRQGRLARWRVRAPTPEQAAFLRGTARRRAAHRRAACAGVYGRGARSRTSARRFDELVTRARRSTAARAAALPAGAAARAARARSATSTRSRTSPARLRVRGRRGGGRRAERARRRARGLERVPDA